MKTNILLVNNTLLKDVKMKTNTNSQPTIHMHRRDFQRIGAVKPGDTIFCDSGILWVTQAGDRRDYLLRQGQTMTVTQRGKVLVEAIDDADMHIA